MQTPRLGFLGVTCPTHKQAVNETGEQWVDVENLKKVEKGLESKGLELVKVDDVISSFYELDEAEKTFLKEDVDMIFIYISTWNWPDQISQFIRNMKKPVMLYALDDSKAWSIGGLAATHGGLDELGIKHKVAYGDIGREDVIGPIVSFARAARVVNVLRKSRFGAIGGQGMGILTGIVDANQWLKDFGILTGFTDQYSLVVEAEKFSQKEVQNYYDQLQSDYKSMPELDKVFDRSIRIYLALEKIIERERYDFTSVKCTFDLSDNYCTACLGQSRLSRRGFVTTCLSDANGALSAYILGLLKPEGEPVFTADVNLALKDENTIKLIDDGAASPTLAADYSREVELHKQPTLEAKASGICTKLIAKPGEVTLMRLARLDGKYVMHITEGQALEVEDKDKEEFYKQCGYPVWPHALIKIKGDMNRFVNNLRSEYIHMTYGNLKDYLKEVAYLYGMEVVEN